MQKIEHDGGTFYQLPVGIWNRRTNEVEPTKGYFSIDGDRVGLCWDGELLRVIEFEAADLIALSVELGKALGEVER